MCECSRCMVPHRRAHSTPSGTPLSFNPHFVFILLYFPTSSLLLFHPLTAKGLARSLVSGCQMWTKSRTFSPPLRHRNHHPLCALGRGFYSNPARRCVPDTQHFCSFFLSARNSSNWFLEAMPVFSTRRFAVGSLRTLQRALED